MKNVLLAGLCALGLQVAAVHAAPQQRALTVDDILKMEDIGHVALTPDGRYLVYEYLVPYQEAPNLDTLGSMEDRSALARILVVDLRSGSQKSRPLFQQSANGGYWLGSLSPDGAAVAVYSLVDGQVRAGAFHFANAQVKWFSSFTPDYKPGMTPPMWLADDELIYPIVPPGTQPAIVYKSGKPSGLSTLWASSSNDTEPSAAVMQSKAAADTRNTKAKRWIRVNARTGVSEPIEVFSPEPRLHLVSATAESKNALKSETATDEEEDSGSAAKRHRKYGTLVATADEGRVAVYRQDFTGGTRLIIKRPWRLAQTVATINPQLAQIAAGAEQKITFKYAGNTFNACMLLPPSYEQGRRYPVIVDVGRNEKGRCQRSNLARFEPYSAQLFAAHGYIVLFPAHPEHLVKTADAPLGALTPLVLAAVDETIRQGYADEDRVGVFGFGAGHLNVLTLLTETERFRAAVASHSASDLASLAGSVPIGAGILPGEDPLLEPQQRQADITPLAELDAEPWKDAKSYTGNSPVFRADLIQTPLLVMHSDFDKTPLGQSEEVFSALHRLRKSSDYVTYWGEGHGSASPANIRDMWRRMYEWFDQFLTQRKVTTSMFGYVHY